MVKRTKIIKKIKTRRQKLARYRGKYVAARSPEEKAAIWQKVTRVAGWLTEDQFLGNSSGGGKQN